MTSSARRPTTSERASFVIASAARFQRRTTPVDVDEEHAVGDGLEHARSLCALLDLAVELRVFDRMSSAACELFRQRKVVRPVAPAGFRRYEGDHAERALAGDERHAHVALEAELAHELEVKIVDGELGTAFPRRSPSMSSLSPVRSTSGGP